MKNFWIGVIVAGVLTTASAAQTGAAGSISTNSSASAGKTSANVGANGNAQVSGASAANAGGQAGASRQGQKGGNSSAEAGAGAGTNASANGNGAVLNGGTTIQAELTKSLDAKKAKPGDEVTAKAMQDVKADGHVVIHKGSKLVGHVTQAQARSKDSAESKLGVIFDHAVLKDGSTVALNAAVQALAAAPAVPVSAGGADSAIAGGSTGPRTGPMGGGGALGGVTGAATSTVGGAANTAGSVAGSATGAVGGTVNGAAGAAANGTLNSASRGVIGLQGLTLNSATASSAQGQGSVISSTTQNVKLDSGTQMVLQVTGQQ